MHQPELTPQQVEALRLLGAYTQGRFDIYMLTGQPRASCRAHVMSILAGHRVPQSQSGITAMRTAFYQIGNITGDCLAAREDNFIRWAQQTVKKLD